MSKTMMEEVVMASSWSEGSEDDDLVRELLDDGSPLLIEPPNTTTKLASSSDDQDQAFNRFISNIYSGPTISDIENALSVTNQRDHFPQLSSARYKMLPNLAKLLFMAFKKKLNYSLWVSLWLYVAWVSWIEHPFGACLMFLFRFFFCFFISEFPYWKGVWVRLRISIPWKSNALATWWVMMDISGESMDRNQLRIAQILGKFSLLYNLYMNIHLLDFNFFKYNLLVKRLQRFP